jgi:hypothetical protein
MGLRFFAMSVLAAWTAATASYALAGNDGTRSYENTAPNFTTRSTSGSNAGELLLNFDTTGATDTTALPITVPAIAPGDFIAVVVEWDQPYVAGAPGSPGATSRIDLCINGGTGSDTITDHDGNAASCTGPNALGADPYQIMIIGNPANAAGNTKEQNLNIVVGLASNAKGGLVPGRIIVSVVEDDGLGSTIASAAASREAGIAALMTHPSVTSTQIYGSPRSGALAMSGATPHFDPVHGFIQADSATLTPALTAPAAPTLTLGKTSVPADTSTTITWASQNASYCTTGGNANAVGAGWSSGTLATSGTFTITPVTVGTYTYTMYCTNAAGKSPTVTATLTVTASKYTGGVGAMDGVMLVSLSALLFVRRRHAGRRSAPRRLR